MRYSVLLAVALLGVAAPVLAQDRTIPTGALDALRYAKPAAAAALLQGRSVDVQKAPVVDVRRAHHRS